MSDVKSLRSQVNRLLAEHHAHQARFERESQAADSAAEHLDHCLQAQQAAQTVAREIQQHAHEAIAGITTRCLKAVFGEGAYELRINFEESRGKTEAQLVFVDDNNRELNPMQAAGGGVIDVASFALRLACLVLSRPPLRRVLVCDEPFKHLSCQYIPAARALLEALAEELGIQIIMVTHNHDLVIGKTVDVGDVV